MILLISLSVLKTDISIDVSQIKKAVIYQARAGLVSLLFRHEILLTVL